MLINRLTDEKGCGKSCEVALGRLENIDDDAGRHGIQFVKSTSAAMAAQLNIEPLPALIYFEDGQPVRYKGKKNNNHKKNIQKIKFPTPTPKTRK